jgi:hypothetical protein
MFDGALNCGEFRWKIFEEISWKIVGKFEKPLEEAKKRFENRLLVGGREESLIHRRWEGFGCIETPTQSNRIIRIQKKC